MKKKVLQRAKVKKASLELRTIARQRTPTEDEAQGLTLRLVDDEGACGSIDLSPSLVAALKEKGLIRYCGHCTRNTITDCTHLKDGGYTAAEYHLEVHDYGDFFSDAHTYRCIAASGVEVPGLSQVLADDETVCSVCKRKASVGRRQEMERIARFYGFLSFPTLREAQTFHNQAENLLAEATREEHDLVTLENRRVAVKDAVALVEYLEMDREKRRRRSSLSRDTSRPIQN